MTTQAIQRVFPMATLNKRQTAYVGIRKVVSFSKDEEGVLRLDSCSSILKVRELLKTSVNLIECWREELKRSVSSPDTESAYLKTIVAMYDNEVAKFVNHHTKLGGL